MLELRDRCEHCQKALPNNNTEAMICSFECTYCYDCAIGLFENVCPSCGGNFEKRPIRPSILLNKYPTAQNSIYAPKSVEQINEMKAKYKGIAPNKR